MSIVFYHILIFGVESAANKRRKMGSATQKLELHMQLAFLQCFEILMTLTQVLQNYLITIFCRLIVHIFTYYGNVL